MSPADLAQRIAALDWSATSLQHQLAVSAAVETLKGNPMTLAPITTTELATGLACRLNGEVVTVDEAFPIEPSNVVPLRKRNKWTTLHQLDGKPWATSFDFGPSGAWAWVVETVAHEWKVPEESVGSLEGSEDQYEGDDLVTIDGIPAYRLRHCYK